MELIRGEVDVYTLVLSPTFTRRQSGQVCSSWHKMFRVFEINLVISLNKIPFCHNFLRWVQRGSWLWVLISFSRSLISARSWRQWWNYFWRWERLLRFIDINRPRGARTPVTISVIKHEVLFSICKGLRALRGLTDPAVLHRQGDLITDCLHQAK